MSYHVFKPLIVWQKKNLLILLCSWKYPGKGGWTYAALPSVKPVESEYFGWIRVKGHIDHYELKQHHLMSMGNGTLFLSVNAEVRKKISKKEGDIVHVVLYVMNLK